MVGLDTQAKVHADKDSGLYAIWLRLDEPCGVRIGTLGDVQFQPGMYAYVGTAQLNRAARIKRHLRTQKPLHWHFDYLRPHGTVVAVSYADRTRRDECKLVDRLRQVTSGVIAYPRFGASDCRCAGHLLHLPSAPDWDTLAEGAGLITRCVATSNEGA